MRYLFAAALLAVAPAFADPVARYGENWVQITDKPCPAAIVSMVPPNIAPMLHEAKAMIGGQAFAACWLIDGPVAHLIYADGDEGLVPLGDFHNEPGV